MQRWIAIGGVGCVAVFALVIGRPAKLAPEAERRGASHRLVERSPRIDGAAEASVRQSLLGISFEPGESRAAPRAAERPLRALELDAGPGAVAAPAALPEPPLAALALALALGARGRSCRRGAR